MKKVRWLLLVVVLMFAGGCLPATQQEVIELTSIVREIVPAVRASVAASSDDTRERIEVVLGQVEEVNDAVATAEDPVDALEKGWGTTAGWNPYYGYGVLGLGILRLFQKKRESDTALEEVVVGIETSKDATGMVVGERLLSNLKSTETLKTRRLVNGIRNA